VPGDLAKPGSLDAAMAGAGKVFLLCSATHDELAWHRSAIDAAARAGVGHLVRRSILGADPGSPARFIRHHGQADGHLRESGVGYTIRSSTHNGTICGDPGATGRRTRPCPAVAAEPEGASMTPPLKMNVYRPADQLGSYVRAFQVFSATQPAGASVLDFGGGDVSVPVCFGDPVLVDDWGRAEVPSAALVGPRRHAVWLRFQGTIDQVNISFFPGAAGVFADLAMPELVDRMAAPEDVWPRDFQEAVAELEPLPTGQRVRGLAGLLLARLEPRREPGPQVREAVRLIRASRGRVTVRRLADHVNLSVSQLERSFTRHVGVGPKLLARQTRVSALAAEAMTYASPGWAWLADKYGYADQAHLARDFRELTGLTPSGLAGTGPDADFLQDALACRSKG
jgi:AraC-like DNA-binding protein